MIDGKNEIFFIRDGLFSLDPGAAFGIVPKPVWSRHVSENASGRIDMTANLLLIKTDKWVGMFDSGLSGSYTQKMKDIFEIRPSGTFWEETEKVLQGRPIDYFFQTHLHFDHTGRALEYSAAGNRARIVAQQEEITNSRKPNELSKNSYPAFPRRRNLKSEAKRS